MSSLFKYILSTLLISIFISNVHANKEKKLPKDFYQIKIDKIKSYLSDRPDSAIILAEKMVSELKNDNDSIIAIGQYLIGIAYYYKGNYFVSSSFYLNALNSDYTHQNLKFKSSCLNNLGINYELTDQYDKAITQYLKCIQIDKELGNYLGIAQTQLNMGLLYNHLNQIQQAHDYLNSALKYFRSIDDHHHLGLAYHNLGKIRMDQNQFEQAIKNLEKSNLEFLQTSSHYERGMLLNNLILCCIELGELEKAEKYLKENEKIIEENNFEYLRATYLTTKVNLLIALNEYDQAYQILKTINIYNSRTASKIKYLETRLAILNGDKLKANKYLQQYANYRDSLESAKNTKLVNDLHIKYQSDTDQKTIQEQTSIIIKRRNQIIFLIIFGSILFITLMVIFILYRRLDKSYRKIYQLNTIHSEHFHSQNRNTSNNDETNVELWNQIQDLIQLEKFWLNNKFSIENLAKKCNTNKSYISKAIKENTNNNFNSFINQLRVEEAKELLTDESSDNYTLDAIAEMSGFNSVSSFYRIFKDHTGITPKRFKDLSSFRK
ncbi:tetratricopeptide repeat protein [Lentimicrobium sp. S6]|uniref:tetratricopeptide repeat protein n=1 Tax=Lentimicrobium sp. S6 TaxID=2735872 RepID=UPI001557B9B3|nr:tetratricopeptide repeat protein [Lentimicrobium sp. S6]NPD47758.1 tetratricopeptide repeat protein [Lentimicrobium sp. S6]